MMDWKEYLKMISLEAVENDFYNATGDRVMIRLDDLQFIGVDIKEVKELINKKLNEFNERMSEVRSRVIGEKRI